MAAYQEGDEVTFYFVMVRDKKSPRVQGWTDKRELAQFYLDFHDSPNLYLNKVRQTIEEMNEFLEENIHDEIKIIHIKTRDTKSPTGYRLIQIPATSTEITFLDEERNSFFCTLVDYSYINEALPYLKKKYVTGLSKALLNDVISHSIHNRATDITSKIDFDELMGLLKSFPVMYGN